jgi:hypothetical protein
MDLLRGEPPAWVASGSGGYGYGDGGYGDGGYCYCYGDGGYGDGGYCYCYGDGGYGYGGYCYCYGYGGYGYSSGDGYGYGYGDGYGYYWLNTLRYFCARWSDAQRARMAELEKLGAKICFWRSKQDATGIHGGKIEPAAVGLVQTVKGPLELCTNRALHATLIPPKWPGDRLWVVALIGEVVGDDEKYGALTREIIGEVTQATQQMTQK